MLFFEINAYKQKHSSITTGRTKKAVYNGTKVTYIGKLSDKVLAAPLPKDKGMTATVTGKGAVDLSASALQGIASVSRAYQAGGAVRLGDGGNDGGFTTQPVVAGTARFLKVSFDAVTWIAATPSPGRQIGRASCRERV